MLILKNTKKKTKNYIKPKKKKKMELDIVTSSPLALGYAKNEKNL